MRYDNIYELVVTSPKSKEEFTSSQRHAWFTFRLITNGSKLLFLFISTRFYLEAVVSTAESDYFSGDICVQKQLWRRFFNLAFKDIQPWVRKSVEIKISRNAIKSVFNYTS